MPTNALLLISTGCAHCPLMLETLSSLLKEGRLGRLEVINIAVKGVPVEVPEVRSVPWLRIGDFELQGLHGKAELLHWVEMAERREGYGLYLAQLLEGGDLERVLDLIRRHPQMLPDLVQSLASPDTPMSVRIGVGAVFEEYAGSELLAATLPQLTGLISSDDSRRRADACHFLAQTGHATAVSLLTPLLQDPSPEVREIVRESLVMLQ